MNTVLETYCSLSGGAGTCIPCCVGLFLVNLTQTRAIFEEGPSPGKIPLSDWPVGMFCVMVNVRGPSPL